MARDIPPAQRLPLLILGFASLIIGVAAAAVESAMSGKVVAPQNL